MDILQKIISIIQKLIRMVYISQQISHGQVAEDPNIK